MAAPFPYSGGKARWADAVWARFGNDRAVYIEPFFGSGAVLLGNPTPCEREVVGDLSPHIANFWRSVKNDPAAVAFHADYPTIQHDIHARNIWLHRWAEENGQRVFEDADYADAKAAGWWAWGKALWINPLYPSVAADGNSHDSIPNLKPNHGGGRGVSMQRTSIKVSGAVNGSRLLPWITALSERLANVVVLRRPWESCVTRSVTTIDKQVAVFLDPPYATMKRTPGMYESDKDGTSDSASRAAFEWAVKHGSDRRFRIAYCCHEGDYPLPEGWSAATRMFKGVRRTDRHDRADMVMFSPHCLAQNQKDLFE